MKNKNYILHPVFDIIICLIVIGLVLFISSCCPKIAENTTTVIHTDTVYRDREILFPATENKYDINFGAICDSLWKSQFSPVKPKPIKQTLQSKDKKGSTEINVDLTTGKGNIICREEEQRIRAERAEMEAQTLRETTKTNVVFTCVKPFHKFLQWYFFITVGLSAIWITFKTGLLKFNIK